MFAFAGAVQWYLDDQNWLRCTEVELVWSVQMYSAEQCARFVYCTECAVINAGVFHNARAQLRVRCGYVPANR